MRKNHTNDGQITKLKCLFNKTFSIKKVTYPLLVYQFVFLTAFAQKTINLT